MDFQLCIRGYCPLYWWTWFIDGGYRPRYLEGRVRVIDLDYFLRGRCRIGSLRCLPPAVMAEGGRLALRGFIGEDIAHLTLPTLPDTHLFLSSPLQSSLAVARGREDEAAREFLRVTALA